MSDTTPTPEAPESAAGEPEAAAGSQSRPVIPRNRRFALAIVAAALVGLLAGAGTVAALDRDDAGDASRPGLNRDADEGKTGRKDSARREQWHKERRQQWREERRERWQRRCGRREARPAMPGDPRERGPAAERRESDEPPVRGPGAGPGRPGCGPRPERPGPGNDDPGPRTGDEQPPRPPA